jgi:hypothetical protein
MNYSRPAQADEHSGMRLDEHCLTEYAQLQSYSQANFCRTHTCLDHKRYPGREEKGSSHIGRHVIGRVAIKESLRKPLSGWVDRKMAVWQARLGGWKACSIIG